MRIEANWFKRATFAPLTMAHNPSTYTVMFKPWREIKHSFISGIRRFIIKLSWLSEVTNYNLKDPWAERKIFMKFEFNSIWNILKYLEIKMRKCSSGNARAMVQKVIKSCQKMM